MSNGRSSIMVFESQVPNDGLGDLKDRLTRIIWDTFSKDVETRRAQVFGPKDQLIPAVDMKFKIDSTTSGIYRGTRYLGFNYAIYAGFPDDAENTSLQECREILDSFKIHWDHLEK